MTKKQTNRQILDSALYGNDLKDLYEVTNSGDRNLVTVSAMLRKVLFQYDATPSNNSQAAKEEQAEKLVFADSVMKKLLDKEPKFTESEINLLKALCMGMPFQAGNVRHQLLQKVHQFEFEKQVDVPSQK